MTDDEKIKPAPSVWDSTPFRDEQEFKANVENFLVRIRYKQGFEFSVKFIQNLPPGYKPEGPLPLEFTVKAWLADSNHPHPAKVLRGTHHIDAFDWADRTELGRLQLIYNWLLEFEMHELGEWFTYDGKRPFDPHEGEKEGA